MNPKPRRLLAVCSLLAAWLLLGGCATPWPRTAPAERETVRLEVPARWHTEAEPAADEDARALAEWWARFDDPILTRLVALALESNTSLRGARAALQQARAVRDTQRARLFPGADASLGGQRSRTEGAPSTSSYSAGVDAGWEIDVFAAVRDGVGAAEAELRASAATLADVRVSVAAEVALTYIALRGGQARLAIARDNLASQLETLEITRWRVQAGLLTSLEAEQALAASEQTRAQIPQLEAAIASNLHGLATLTGESADRLRWVTVPSERVPEADERLVLTLPADTLRQRPDVRAAEERVNAALARVSQAQALRYPSFRIGGSLGLRSSSAADLFDDATRVSTLFGTVSLPLIDGGARRAQVQAQESALDQAVTAYEATLLAALAEVEDALTALARDRLRLSHLRGAAEAAGNAALLASHRYASGLVDYQTVLDTQRTLLATQDGVASTATELSFGYVRLYKALGGGWQGEDGDRP